jgi:hypothetical protein
MVSDAPGRVLELISDDFTMSVQFSKDAGAAAEFSGVHAGLVAYLEQREQSVLVHHVTHGSRLGNVELVLGQTTGQRLVRSLVQRLRASRRYRPMRCLLICRTPEVDFPHA